MAAYNRLVFWVANQSFARLERRADTGCGTPISTTSRTNTVANWWRWT